MVTGDAAMAAVMDIMRGPIVWGASDCSAAACDVFARLHGVDPMAPLRGLYRSERGAARLVRAYGGWIALCARLATQAGLRAGDGAPGELGLLCHDGRFSLAVCVGGGLWAGRIEGGFQTAGGVVQSWQN